MRRIVIAVDGSGPSEAAVEAGLELARDFGAAATFVTVRRSVPPLLGEPFYQRRLTERVAEARAAIASALDRAERAQVEADYEILEGDPAEEIVRIGRSRAADVIVVGTHGRGAVAGTLLGSVSRAVVRDADRPVLVAPSAAERHAA